MEPLWGNRRRPMAASGAAIGDPARLGTAMWLQSTGVPGLKPDVSLPIVMNLRDLELDVRFHLGRFRDEPDH